MCVVRQERSSAVVVVVVVIVVVVVVVFVIIIVVVVVIITLFVTAIRFFSLLSSSSSSSSPSSSPRSSSFRHCCCRRRRRYCSHGDLGLGRRRCFVCSLWLRISQTITVSVDLTRIDTHREERLPARTWCFQDLTNYTASNFSRIFWGRDGVSDERQKRPKMVLL